MTRETHEDFEPTECPACEQTFYTKLALQGHTARCDEGREELYGRE